MLRKSGVIAPVVLCGLLLAPAAWAGPPLLCWSFDIEGERSLPFGQGGWRATRTDYETRNLVVDTLGLLHPNAPVIVRMETLRRATAYVLDNKSVAQELKARLEARVRLAEASGKPDALAVFDYGYLLGIYSQTGHHLQPALGGDAGGGYEMVKKAIELRGGDGEMELAAAMMSVERLWGRRKGDHLERALAAAKPGSLLARNLLRQRELLGLGPAVVARLSASPRP
jgi:hypothetical protein